MTNAAIREAQSSLISLDIDRPGQWQEVGCVEYESILSAHPDAHVWSSLTDSDGIFGSPMTFTLWGEGESPLLTTLVTYEDGAPKKCSHGYFEEAL